jgi:pyruvate/2-oxoglutarate dehydrogenase complex dihydrolipoamide dehydrogenase (E3) component
VAIPLLPGDPHDDRLRANVRPPGWVNPTPAARYQFVVIGAGPAGLVAAAAAAGLGARVALAERDLMGGDCLNVGCVPSKALLRAAKAAAAVRRAKEFGVRAGEPEVDFAAVMERVRRVRAELSAVDSAERFRKLGVDVFLGEGKFLNEDTVEVNGAKLRFGRCLIATGARPVIPDVPGLKESRWFTNETVFALTELPRRLLVIGGGPVGCELGQAFARLGSEVTLAARNGVLPREDAEARAVIEAALRADGIHLRAGVPAVNGFDAVLVAAGRQPNVERLNLEAGGVRSTPAGITADRYLCTTNRRVFAAGDVIDRPHGACRFTHAADAAARIVVRNVTLPRAAWAAFDGYRMPRCTYTEPELGHVGVWDGGGGMAKNYQGLTFRVDSDHLDRAACDGGAGFVKVVVERDSDRIVGATVVGPHAGELVGTVSLAMTHRIGLKKLANTVFPYPTYTEALRKIADQYNRTRLTPLAARVIRGWLRWFR